MIYLLKNLNLIFIFNAKCACTTIKNIICQIDNIKILKYYEVHRLNFNNITISDILTTYKNYPIIFFKRNPYDRLASGYTKVKNKFILKFIFRKDKTQQECNKLVNNGDISFSNFINLIINTNPKYLDQHYIPQTFNKEIFLSNHKNLFMYDIDNLNNFDSYLKNNFNINVDLNIRQKYKTKKYKIPENLKRKVYNYYKKDFILLNYPMNKQKIIEYFQFSNKNNFLIYFCLIILIVFIINQIKLN